MPRRRDAVVARVSEAHPATPTLPDDTTRHFPVWFCPGTDYVDRRLKARELAMVRYRRNRHCGGTYFFTVVLRDRRSDLLVRHVDHLRTSWRNASARIAHEVVAAVVMPDHLHAVIGMQDGADNYSRLWLEIKKGFSRRLPNTQPSPWQDRFWEHTIRNDADLRAHVDYVHFNPVKHGWATRAADWPFSSFHRYVRGGSLSADWGIAAAPPRAED